MKTPRVIDRSPERRGSSSTGLIKKIIFVGPIMCEFPFRSFAVSNWLVHKSKQLLRKSLPF